MEKIGMEAYIDVALFITPTITASLSQLFLTDTEEKKQSFVSHHTKYQNFTDKS